MVDVRKILNFSSFIILKDLLVGFYPISGKAYLMQRDDVLDTK